MAKDLVNEWYRGNIFDDASELAERYCDIQGVPTIARKIEEHKEDYLEDLNILYNNNVDVLSSAVKIYNHWHMKKHEAKKLAIILLIVSIGLNFTSKIGVLTFFTGILYNLSSVAFLISLIVIFIFKKIENKKWSQYYDAEKNLTNRANGITNQYREIARKHYNKIDSLYLDSLEPTHRETVLMRRDQERHHMEIMQAQRQHQQKIEKEQEEILRTQKKLLEIEEERERRNKENNRW